MKGWREADKHPPMTHIHIAFWCSTTDAFNDNKPLCSRMNGVRKSGFFFFIIIITVIVVEPG